MISLAFLHGYDVTCSRTLICEARSSRVYVQVWILVSFVFKKARSERRNFTGDFLVMNETQYKWEINIAIPRGEMPRELNDEEGTRRSSRETIFLASSRENSQQHRWHSRLRHWTVLPVWLCNPHGSHNNPVMRALKHAQITTYRCSE